MYVYIYTIYIYIYIYIYIHSMSIHTKIVYKPLQTRKYKYKLNIYI